MKIKPSSYFLMVILGFGLVMAVFSLRLPGLEPKLAPLLVSALILLLAGIELAKELLAKEERRGAQKPGSTIEAKVILRRYASFAIFVLGFLAATYLLGFIIAIPLFIMTYLKSRAIGWFRSIGIAVLTTVSVYTLFEVLLKLSMYRGIFWGMLFS